MAKDNPTFRHRLVDALTEATCFADAASRVPLIIPFDIDEIVAGADQLGSRRILLTRDDSESLSALHAENRLFIAALKAGLQIPGDLLECLLARRSIGRIRYELAATETAFVVTRRYELVEEYAAFMAANAGNIPEPHPVYDGLDRSLLDHDFAPSLRLDTATIAEGAALPRRGPRGRIPAALGLIVSAMARAGRAGSRAWPGAASTRALWTSAAGTLSAEAPA